MLRSMTKSVLAAAMVMTGLTVCDLKRNDTDEAKIAGNVSAGLIAMAATYEVGSRLKARNLRSRDGGSPSPK